MQPLETERLKYWAEVIMLDPRFCGATGQGAYWAVASEQVNQAAAQILTDRETDMRLEKVAAAKRTKRTKKTATGKTENLDEEGFEPVQQALDLGGAKIVVNKIKQAQRKASKTVVVDALTRANGRVVDADKVLGVSRQGALYWINALGLDYKKFRIPEPNRSGS